MKNIWKWILGVALALVVFAALGYFTYNWGGAMAYGHPMMYRFDSDDWQGPRGGFDRHPMRMTPGMGAWGGFGFMPFLPFMFFGGLLRLLLPLGALALTAYLAYQKGKRDGASSAAIQPASPAAPEPGA
ncbi:MAG: hypothetical protein ACOYYJ_00890 [Chloroflexota bacterium]